MTSDFRRTLVCQKCENSAHLGLVIIFSFGFNAYDFDDIQMANLAVKMFDELFREER